ncbi:BrnT family toxin [Undibacterium sp.]|uniref:BrnT family toxin n=1 Tax=Undibacterium sp. TaxID=1914977 RepID=UPI0025E55E0C|nr:BrnT family toxin [Undibacterium sp.]
MDDVDFEWDEAKNRANQKKHSLSFKYATRVFADPFMLLFPGDDETGEERWRAFGQVGGQAIIMVAHT